MNVFQPAMINRVTFATWARKQGLRRHSSATWYVPDLGAIPERLLAGGTVDGKPYTAVEPEPPKRRGRPPKPKPEPVTEPDVEPEVEVVVQDESAQVHDTVEEEYR